MTAPTRNQVVEWVSEHIGKTPPAGPYGVQSPDLVNLYLAELWEARHVRGNGCDMADRVGAALGWRVDDQAARVRLGDVVSLHAFQSGGRSMGMRPGRGMATGPHGHVGVGVEDGERHVVVLAVSGRPDDVAGAHLQLYPRDAVAAIAKAPLSPATWSAR